MPLRDFKNLVRSQFALAVQERFKTLPPGIKVEEFEQSRPIFGGEINPSESTTVGEQLMQARSTNPVPQASDPNFDTLVTAVTLLEKQPLE